MFGIPNPQWLLQPWKNLTHFTEELYSALRSGAPVVHNGPVVVRVKEGQTGLRIERDDTSPPDFAPPVRLGSPVAESGPPEWKTYQAKARDRASRPPGMPFEDKSEARVAPGVDSTIPGRRRREAPMFSVDGPVEFTGPPVRFSKPPEVFDAKKKEWYTPKEWKKPEDTSLTVPGGGGGGTTVFIGKIQSCVPGGPAKVLLFPDGPTGDPSPTDPVEVALPTIDPDEDMQGVTWLPNIYQFSDSGGNNSYVCYPPVWVS